MKKNKNKNQDVKISACMMVKNEEEMLPRCLNSIKHLVDEIIVVDTGSSDSTVDIAASFGAKVYHHPWENDFSKHRNQSISYATGNWFFIVDADEELNAYDLKKKDLKARLAKAPGELHCFLITAMDKDKTDNVTSITETARIFRNDVGVEYRGIVHNTAYYSGKAGHLDLQIFHYGYALSKEKMAAKYKRTSGLLFKRIEKDSKDYAAYFYLFQVFMEMKISQDAIKYAEQCLRLLSSECVDPVEASFFYSLYHGVASAYLQLKQYEKAEAIVRKGLLILPDEVDLFYDISAIGFFSNRPHLMIEGAENYLRVVEEFRTNTSRAGTRFVFSTTKEVEKTVTFWLMFGYIAADRVNEFEILWDKKQDKIIGKPAFQKRLLSALEEKGAFRAIEKMASSLFNKFDKILPENHKLVLSYLMIALKKKMILDENRTAEVGQLFDKIAAHYLDITESYKDIPVDAAVILAEFLLQKSLSDYFLDLTLMLFERVLSGQIETLDTKETLAKGYDLIANKQKKNEKGTLISLVCLNLSWELTQDTVYLKRIEKIMSGTSSSSSSGNVHSKQGKISMSSNKPSLFRTSYVEVDITPKFSKDNPVVLQGKPGEVRMANQIASPLKMQILLIEGENRTKMLWVSADLFGFGKEMVEFLNRAVSNWGIPPEGIFLNASNNCYSPGTVPHISFLGTYYKKYAMEIAGLINHYLSPLYDSLEPTYIFTGKSVTSDLNSIQSTDVGERIINVYEQEIPFFLLKQQDSGKKILLANHGSRLDNIGDGNCISAELPGYFRDELIRRGKIDQAMFFQGAFVNSQETELKNKDAKFPGALKIAEEKGRILARSIQNELDGGRTIPLTSSSINYTSQEVLLPFDTFSDIKEINYLKNDPNTPEAVKEWASRLLVQYPDGQFPHIFSLPVQMAFIGETCHIISFPAILDPELGTIFRQMNDPSGLSFVFGCTNGLVCELPNDANISKGLYRKGMSPYYYMIPNYFSEGVNSALKSSIKQGYAAIEKQPSPATPRNIHGEYRDAMKRTLFDFTHYAHQRHPEEKLNTDFFRKQIPVAPLIGNETPITSMGSCFARNIAKYLMQNKYNYLVTESPFRQASAHWDQVFSTACMRQIFEYTFLKDWNPKVRWWPKDEMVQDPFRRAVLYDKTSCDDAFETHKKSSYEALAKAKVIILTLGLIEIWRDRRDKMTFYKVPSPRIYDADIHEFHIQKPEECVEDLDRIHDIIEKNNPQTSFIVTVSPIPLDATFRNDVDIVTANMFSKSTLRIAAEVFASKHRNVYYFPSYEIITSVMEQPYEKDRRHIKIDAIQEMMDIFKTWFMKE